MNKKKFILFGIIFFLSGGCFAEVELDNLSDLDTTWDGQEIITDKDFEDAINVIEGNKNKVKQKQRLKLIKRISGGGTSLHSDLSPESEITAMGVLHKDCDSGLLLNVPVNLIIEDVVLDKGFYKVVAQEDNVGNLYLLFYQSQFYKGKIRASRTDDDYQEPDLNFVRLQPFNSKFVKIIYGSLKYNAYAYVRFI